MSLWDKLKDMFKSEEVCNCRNCTNKRLGKYIGYMPCCKNKDNITPPRKK